MSAQALYLTAVGPDQKKIFTWSWPIRKPEITSIRNTSSVSKRAIAIRDSGDQLNIRCDRINYLFSKTNGCLQQVKTPYGTIPLSEGPQVAGIDLMLKKFKFYPEGDQYIIEAGYEGLAALNVKWIFVSGQKVKLSYSYTQKGDA